MTSFDKGLHARDKYQWYGKNLKKTFYLQFKSMNNDCILHVHLTRTRTSVQVIEDSMVSKYIFQVATSATTQVANVLQF